MMGAIAADSCSSPVRERIFLNEKLGARVTTPRLGTATIQQ